MNRIYKVVWSKTRNCYVVASELAKSNTKSSSTSMGSRKSLLTLAVLAMMLVPMGSVFANEHIGPPADIITVKEAHAGKDYHVYTVEGMDKRLSALEAGTVDLSALEAADAQQRKDIADLRADMTKGFVIGAAVDVVQELEIKELQNRTAVIQGDTLTIQHVNAETVTATNVDSEYVGAKIVEAGLVDADKVKTGYLDANRADIDRLNAEKVKTGYLDANRADIDRLNAEKVTALQVNALETNTGVLNAGVANSLVTNTGVLNAVAVNSLVTNTGVLYADQVNADDVNAKNVNTWNMTTINGKVLNNLNVGNAVTAKAVHADNVYAKEVYTQGMTTINAKVLNDLTVDGHTTTKDLTVTGETVVNNLTVSGQTTVNDLTVTGFTSLKDTNVDGTFIVNKGTKNQIRIDKTGLTVGLHSTHMDDDGLYAGGHSATEAKAALSSDGSLKGADGAFTVDTTGNVNATAYQVDGLTYIDGNGINVNGHKITNIQDGEVSPTSMDAVNGRQLYNTRVDVANLEDTVAKVGANAAAMANLHPLPYEPGMKWSIAAALGNFKDETALAIGAFYRPNEDVMVNFSTAIGNGENMLGAGVSFRVGQSTKRVAQAEADAERELLKQQVKELSEKVDALLAAAPAK